MDEFDIEASDGEEINSLDDLENSSDFTFETLLDVKREIQDLEEENAFEIKEEPLFDGDFPSLDINACIWNVKKESQRPQEPAFKVEGYRSLPEGCDEDRKTRENCEGNLPSKSHDTPIRAVGLQDDRSNGQLKDIETGKKTAISDNGQTSSGDGARRRNVLRSCSVILEDCMKQLETRTDARIVPHPRSSFSRGQAARSRKRSYECKDCGKRFSQTNHLNVHQRTHTGEKPYLCKDCGKRFSDGSSWVRHVRTHTGDKPHLCKHCGKRYAERSTLNDHVRTHTKEKPYLCKDCGKRFARRHHLKVHLRMHTGEKPFLCDDCGKRFSRRDHCLLHQRTHTGEKPFPCSDCGKRYSYSSALTLHRRTHAEDSSNA